MSAAIDIALGFVLQRIPDGAFVAPPGLDRSYTRRLQEARVFGTAEAAQANACGNERVVSVADAFSKYFTRR